MTELDRRHDDERLTEIEAKLDKLAADVEELVAAWKAANVIVGFIKWAGGIATALTAVAPSFIGTRGSLTNHAGLTLKKKATNSSGIICVTQPDTAIQKIKEIMNSSTGQLFILTPDRTVAESMAKKIEPETHVIHSGLSSKQQKNIYRGILDGSIKLLVGTRIGLFLPWKSLEHIIVEDPLNEIYKSDMAPRYNAPDVARQVAALHQAAITWLTPALSTVQYHLSESKAIIVDQQKPYWPAITLSTTQEEQEAGDRTLFGRAARDVLLDAYEQRTPLLIYSARRGYATVARCARCRASVLCTTCDIPLRWHRTSEDMLVC